MPGVAQARRVRREVLDRAAERGDPALRWLNDAHRQRPAGPELWDEAWANRHRLVAELARGGGSFLDLGGMFGIAGDIAFRAEAAGASRVVIFDGMDPSPEFDERHRTSNSKIEFVQGDLHDPDDMAALGSFDVVWCTGVLYHSPHPFQCLQHLRLLARDRLVLGTHVIPEIPGIEQACMFYPGISTAMQDTFADVNKGGRHQYPGMMVPYDPTPLMAYANMWWGISPSALRAMLHYTGFDVTNEYQLFPFWIDVVAKLGGQSLDTYPLKGQSAERVRDRYADLPADQVPAYAQNQLRAILGS